MRASTYRCSLSRFPLHSSQAAKIMRTWSLILLLPLSAGCEERCEGCQDWASFIFCLWIILLADPQAQTFYIHITDGQRRKSSERCSFSIYPKQRQTGSGCLGCWRHPGPSGKLLVIAWLLVLFFSLRSELTVISPEKPQLELLWKYTLYSLLQRTGESSAARETGISQNHLNYLLHW